MVFNATFSNISPISYGGSILFFIGRYHKSALSQRLTLPIYKDIHEKYQIEEIFPKRSEEMKNK